MYWRRQHAFGQPCNVQTAKPEGEPNVGFGKIVRVSYGTPNEAFAAQSSLVIAALSKVSGDAGAAASAGVEYRFEFAIVGSCHHYPPRGQRRPCDQTSWRRPCQLPLAARNAANVREQRRGRLPKSEVLRPRIGGLPRPTCGAREVQEAAICVGARQADFMCFCTCHPSSCRVRPTRSSEAKAPTSGSIRAWDGPSASPTSTYGWSASVLINRINPPPSPPTNRPHERMPLACVYARAGRFFAVRRLCAAPERARSSSSQRLSVRSWQLSTRTPLYSCACLQYPLRVVLTCVQ